MTPIKAVQIAEVAAALGLNIEFFSQTNTNAENAIIAEHGDRIEIIEKAADKTTGIFVDGELVYFACDGESCDLEDKAELVAYLRA